MVTSIARQSVIIKCNMQSSVLLGNYEFYYLSGLMKKIYGLDISEDMMPEELFSHIQDKLDTLESDDKREAYLLKLVSIYKPLENYDEQMKELFRWGASEEHMWEVHLGTR